MPAWLAQKAARCSQGRATPATEAMLTMLPPRSPFSSAITRPVSWLMKKVPFRLTSRQRSQSHSSILSTVEAGMTRALLTRMSSRPHSARAASISLTQWNLFDTSASTARASPPAWRIAAATRSARSGLISLTATRAPAAARARAMASPVPWPAPVTIATLPSNGALPGFVQHGDAGQFVALKHLQAGAAAGADVRHALGQAGLLDGCRRIAAADHDFRSVL